MSKKKGRKGKKKKPASGAFGSSGRKQTASSRVLDERELMEAGREREEFMRMVQRAMEKEDFSSPEEMNAFLQEKFTGRGMDEMLGEEDEAELTVGDRARRLVLGIGEEMSAAQRRQVARKALALSEDCLEAWQELGDCSANAKQAVAKYDEGIARGRVRFAREIEEVTPEFGLWGHLEGRVFMTLLEARAEALIEDGSIEEGAKQYREILKLNPGDNQGVRVNLLRLYLVLAELAEAEALLEEYADDALVEMSYGRALLEVVKAMQGREKEIFDALEDLEEVEDFDEALGSEFAAAREELGRAVKRNPFVPALVCHPYLFEAGPPPTYRMGGPDEALVYAQEWAPLWNIFQVPFYLLVARIEQGAPAMTPDDSDELEPIMSMLDEGSGDPWWMEVE